MTTSGLNLWKELVESGKVPSSEYLANNAMTSRDNSLYADAVDVSPNAGFTKSTKPWLAVNPHYSKINVRRKPVRRIRSYRSIARWFGCANRK